MKKHEVEVGRIYFARVGQNLTEVRVDAIQVIPGMIRRFGLGLGRKVTPDRTLYVCTNLRTKREVKFRSAMKLRALVA